MGEDIILLDFFSEDYLERSAEDSMAYKFESNARLFTINYEISDIIKGYYPQIGLTAREGITVMYRHAGESQWYNIDCYTIVKSIKINMNHFIKKGEYYEIMIYGPIIGKLSKLEIEVNDDDYISILDDMPDQTIAVAGGSHSFGIGCTTTACMFSNILERKLNAEVFHVAYNSKNFLNDIYNFYDNHNPPVADIGILEIDHFSQNELVIEETLPKLIPLMKQRCVKLIGWYCIPDSKAFKRVIANNTIRDYINNGDIEIIDMSFVYRDEYKNMCTYNNFYINDSGNMMIYKKLEEKIRGLAQWNI